MSCIPPPAIPNRSVLSKLADVAAIIQVFAVAAAFVALILQFEATNRIESENRNQRTLEYIQKELFILRSNAVLFRDEAAELERISKEKNAPLNLLSLEPQVDRILFSFELIQICNELQLCEPEVLSRLFCPEAQVFLAYGKPFLALAEAKAHQFLTSCL